MLIAWLGLLLGCTAEDSDSDVSLPPQDTGELPRDTDVVEFPEDTSLDSDLNVEPTHVLTYKQFGYWDVIDGVFSGQLRVVEWVDGDVPDLDTADTDTDTDVIEDTDLPLLPTCDLLFALTAVPSPDATCAGCEPAWEITYTQIPQAPAEGEEPVLGERINCHDPELPPEGGVRTLAFHPGDGKILLDFQGMSLWLPWFDARRLTEPDPTTRIAFEWTAAVGVSIEEMDR